MNPLKENKNYSSKTTLCLLKRGKRTEIHVLLVRKSHKI